MSNQDVSINPTTTRMSTGYLVRLALFSAIAFVVMFFEFPITALFPAYLKIDLSDVIAFIGGMVMGPVAVVFIELVKNILNFLLKSSTGGVGELANFSVGVALILPAVMIARKKDGIPRLIIAFVVGIISMILIASIGNYFIFLPLYGVGTPADRMAMIIPVLAPFNAIKGVIVGTIAIVLHLSMKRIYKYIK